MATMLAACTTSGYAQGAVNRMFAGFQYHHQRLWAHRPEIDPYNDNYIQSFELILGIRSSGKHHWQQLYNSPSYGLGFFYSDLGHPDVLGEVMSGFVFFEVPLGERQIIKRRLNTALGVSRLSQFYNPDSNPENQFIGTPWNIHFNIKYGLVINIAGQLQILPGVSFTHYSNGAYKKPNRGLNLFDANVGVRFYLSNQGSFSLPVRDDILSTWPGDQRFLVLYSTGLMQRDIDDPHYRAHTLSFAVDEQTGPRSRWGVGLEIFYDDHAKDLAREVDLQAGFSTFVRAGVFVSHEIMINNLSLHMGLGTYVYRGQETERPVYKRVALRYNLGYGLYSHFGIKAHQGRADHMEWGLGIAL